MQMLWDTGLKMSPRSGKLFIPGPVYHGEGTCLKCKKCLKLEIECWRTLGLKCDIDSSESNKFDWDGEDIRLYFWKSPLWVIHTYY
jgi:hypothetical protein